MKVEHAEELLEAGEVFLEAVFRELREHGSDGSGLFDEGFRFEKALAAARSSRRPAFGTPRRQLEARVELEPSPFEQLELEAA